MYCHLTDDWKMAQNSDKYWQMACDGHLYPHPDPLKHWSGFNYIQTDV